MTGVHWLLAHCSVLKVRTPPEEALPGSGLPTTRSRRPSSRRRPAHPVLSRSVTSDAPPCCVPLSGRWLPCRILLPGLSPGTTLIVRQAIGHRQTSQSAPKSHVRASDSRPAGVGSMEPSDSSKLAPTNLPHGTG